MRERYIYYISILTLLIFTGCERRPLEDDFIEEAQIMVEINWQESRMEPGEASVLFYPQDGGGMRTLYIYGNRGTINLKVGKYSVVTFNNKFDDFDAIAFRGTDKYETLQAYLKPSNIADYAPASGEKVVDNPDMLVSDSQDEFVVTQAMADRTHEEMVQQQNSGTKTPYATTPDITLNMKAVTIQANLTVHIRNLYLIRKGTQNGIIKGFSEGISLSTRKPISTTVTQFMELPEAKYYEDNYKDGIMRGTITVFGECSVAEGAPKQKVYFMLRSMLRDEPSTFFKHEVEITKQIEYHTDVGLQISMIIGADAEKENPPIVVPPVDLGDANSGFNPNVDDWEEEEEIVKPL